MPRLAIRRRTLPHNVFIGEFEQMVLLAVLQEGNRAHALGVRDRMGQVAGRRIARGALYRTLDRLESKGYVRWRVEAGGPERGGHARRMFTVTARGIAALRTSRRVLLELWTGLEDVLL
jgi:DNA-binding PadR family transcriptional regulator